jgi:hypothetical protein
LSFSIPPHSFEVNFYILIFTIRSDNILKLCYILLDFSLSFKPNKNKYFLHNNIIIIVFKIFIVISLFIFLQ